MVKVITYGTFDFLHEGHINLLKRARALGDYLIVGVTTENYDISRGKINVRQSLMERMEAVRKTGIADEVIPEEYLGQKIDDIKRNNVAIFAIGSDWEGQFDYLKEYCRVVYLPRTEGVSSTQIRSAGVVRIGVIGADPSSVKLKTQADFVNGAEMTGLYQDEPISDIGRSFAKCYDTYEELLSDNDAVYVATRPERRYALIRQALLAGKHVISESPIAMRRSQAGELYDLAAEHRVRLFESIKVAYSLPFSRLVLLVKSGLIGEVKSIDVTCTSLENNDWLRETRYYSSFTGWGPVALLPIIKILGTQYDRLSLSTLDGEEMPDIYTKADLVYPGALATLHVGVGVKSEGDLRISGTKGYIYVPAPWWKSGYFEARFEDATKNKRYFYENEGEGLRMELVQFVRCIGNGEDNYYMDREQSEAISAVMERFAEGASPADA